MARSLMVAKASAWVGALMLGWWVGVLVYFLPRRSWLRATASGCNRPAPEPISPSVILART
nr:DUF3180 family protein [Mycobacterium marseillense]